jgi:hypothetical protein
MVHRRIYRTTYRIHALVAEPPLGSLEKTVRGLLIITTVEKAEKTDSIVVMVVVPSVLDRRHPSDDPAISLRDEERPLRLLIEGVSTSIQAIPHDDAEWRNPTGRGGLVMDPPSCVHKARRAPPPLYLENLESHLEPLPSRRTVVKQFMSDSLLKIQMRESTSHFDKKLRALDLPTTSIV